MFFESSVLLLVCLAFIPKARLRVILPWAMARRQWCLVALAPFFFLILMGSREPGVLMPLVLLGQLWAALTFVSAFGAGGRRARLAHVAFSALPMMVIVPIFGPGRFFEGDHGANVWFLDYVNKLFIAWVEPILGVIGLGAQVPEVLSSLSESLASVARGLPALHMSFELILTPALYVMVQRWVPSLPRGEDAFARPLERGFLAFGALAWGGAYVSPVSWPFLLLAQLAWGQFFVFGLSHLHRSIQRLEGGEGLGFGLGFGPILLFCMGLWFFPALCHGVVALGVLLSLLQGVRTAPLVDGPLASTLSESLGATMARRWGPVMAVLGVLLPLKLVGGPVLTLSRAPGLNGPGLHRVSMDSEGVVQLEGGGRALRMDAFEAPGIPGEVPITGVRPSEAVDWCEGRGLHLCEESEWAWGCSLGEDRHYILGGAQASFATADALRDRCNLDHPQGAIAPSGAHSGCINAAGVGDLAGNAWEWVRVRGEPGWWGLAGGYFRYGDEQTPSCAFRVLVHEAQLPILDLETIGFRCCG